VAAGVSDETRAKGFKGLINTTRRSVGWSIARRN